MSRIFENEFIISILKLNDQHIDIFIFNFTNSWSWFKNITDKGMEYFSQMFQTNHTLIILGLNNNQIGDKRVQLLGNVLTTRNRTRNFKPLFQ